MTVYENGRLLKDWTLDEVRKNAEIDLAMGESKRRGI